MMSAGWPLAALRNSSKCRKVGRAADGAGESENTTQCEALTMLCCQVMGERRSNRRGGASGNFKFKVFRPMVIHNFLQ
ncbi:hypothetical protein ACNKHX_09950 [Shigella flexneri]